MILRVKLLLVLFSLFILSTPYSINAQSASGRLYFNPDKAEVSNGSEFTTTIYVDTAGSDAGGTGIILNYNPVFLEAVSITPGIIFSDYPLAAIDNESGKVAVSGISGSADQLFNGNDVFATITWRSKKTGSTDISFTFEPGSTSDSNIAVSFGNGDILSDVNTFTASVVVGSSSVTNTSSSPEPASTQEKSFLDRALDSISRLLGKEPQGEIDPYAPITRRDPITDLSGEREELSFTSEGSGLPLGLIAGIVVFLLVVLIIIIVVIKKAKSRKTSSVVVQNVDTPQSPPVPPAV